MNKSKFSVEGQIKKQIEEREITPTRDLWSEIETQTATNTTAKSKINWFLVAACLVLLVSLSAVLLFDNDKTIAPQMVENSSPSKNIQPENTIETVVPALLAEKTEIAATKSVDVVLPSENKISKPNVVAKTELPLIKAKQEQVIPVNYKNQISQSIAKIDSTKIPTKRKKYVDASTLLFSVEHKDVIEKSKDGSNVASIDLNSK